MQLGQKIKSLRVSNGLNQVRLASKIGVSQTAISKWESGAANPTLSHLQTLAKVMDIKVSHFLESE